MIEIMQRNLLILVVMSGILAAPFLCDAGVTVHECHCETVECCADEAACEPDPCDDVYKDTRQNEDTVDDPGTAATVQVGTVLPASSPFPSPSATCDCDQSIPDRTLPLLI